MSAQETITNPIKKMIEDRLKVDAAIKKGRPINKIPGVKVVNPLKK